MMDYLILENLNMAVLSKRRKTVRSVLEKEKKKSDMMQRCCLMHNYKDDISCDASMRPFHTSTMHMRKRDR